MAVSAGLTLARGFAVAQVCARADFGHYALAVAAGAFFSSPLGLGAIERTNKYFPQLHVDGHARHAVRVADGLARAVVLRALAFTLAAAMLVLAVGRSGWVSTIAAVGATALSIGVQSVYASAQRAGGNLPDLGKATIFRTSVALFAGIAGALLWSWQGAVAGEVLASVGGAFLSRHYALRRAGPPAEAIPPGAPSAFDLWLFGSFLLVSIPFYLDRWLVSGTYGIATAGSYGVLMLFVSGASTLVTIVAQKVGPQLVRQERSGAAFREQFVLFAGSVAAIAGLVLAGMAGAWFLLIVGPLAPMAAKYGIDSSALWITAMLAVAQVSMLGDWLLLAHDRERQVFAAAVIYLSGLGVGVGAIIWLQLGLAWFIGALALARALHFATQLAFVWSMPSAAGLRSRAARLSGESSG